nr:MAG TPA: hypothetical protein [Caudoviricetes sp.]
MLLYFYHYHSNLLHLNYIHLYKYINHFYLFLLILYHLF